MQTTTVITPTTPATITPRFPTGVSTSGIEQEPNRQWAMRPADQRYETLTALRDAVVARRMRSASRDVDPSEMEVEAGDAGLRLSTDRGLLQPTHWSFGQLAQTAGAPAGYLRTLPGDLAARCLNTGLARKGESVKLMGLRDPEGGPNTLQAVTSTTYGRIWDADVILAVERIVERSGGRYFNPKDWSGKPSGLYASDHDVFAFMIDGGSIVDGGGDRDQLHRGFYVWNSETGAKTFGLSTFLFRVVCGNHLIWGAEDVTKLLIRHTSGGPMRFERDAAPALRAYVDASPAPMISQIARAKAVPLAGLVNIPGRDFARDPLDADWVAGFAKRFGFTKGEVNDGLNFARAEEGRVHSVWDMLNGLTASARALEFVDARVDLERRAGKLMELVA